MDLRICGICGSKNLRICGSALAALALFAASACTRSAPVRVGVVFDNNWILGPVTLTAGEQQRIKAQAFATLRRAFEGYAVDFAEDADRDRLIRLNRHLFGSGVTAIGSKISDVNLDSVHLTLLAVTGCPNIVSCQAYSRESLIDALGRGIGATAAHELGHQAGLLFVRDRDCDDCYDGMTATTRAHFFGDKHWSPDSLAAMRHVLPSAP